MRGIRMKLHNFENETFNMNVTGKKLGVKLFWDV